jgi:hypothetical protein
MKEPRVENQTPSSKKNKTPTNWGRLCSMIAVALVLFMAAYIPTGPYKQYKKARDHVKSLKADLEEANNALKMEEMRIESQKVIMDGIKSRKPNFDMWTLMNGILTEMKVKERASLEPYKPPKSDKAKQEDYAMLQLRLQGLSLTELVDLLYRIYASNNLIVVYRVEFLRPTPNGVGLECNIVFLTPKNPSASAA